LSLVVACCHLYPLVIACCLLPRAFAWCRLLPLGVIQYVVAFCLLSLEAGKCLSLVVACRLLLLPVSTPNSPFTHVSRPLLPLPVSLIYHLLSLVSHLLSLVTPRQSLICLFIPPFVLFCSCTCRLSSLVSCLVLHCCKSSERLGLKCKFSLASATNIFLELDFKSPCTHENFNFVWNKKIT
jgi:hypothetical protein